jgi:hypothetical protein
MIEIESPHEPHKSVTLMNSNLAFKLNEAYRVGSKRETEQAVLNVSRLCETFFCFTYSYSP